PKAHRPVHQSLFLIQGHGVHPVGEQVLPDLTDPGLCVGLRGKLCGAIAAGVLPMETHGLVSGERVRSGSRKMTWPRASSIAAMVASSSSTPDALTLSAICSGRVAPMMAALTASFCSTQANASWPMLRPWPSAIGRRRWTASRIGSLSNRLMKVDPLLSVARDPGGGG